MIEKPLVEISEQIGIIFYGELLKIMYKSTVASHTLPAKHLLYHTIKTGHFQMLIPAGTAPDRYNKLHNELHWIIPSVRPLNRKRGLFQYLAKGHLIEHLFKESNATPRSYFLIGELNFQVRHGIRISYS